MTRIKVSRRMPAPHDRVWRALADLATHVTWMKDARSIEFQSDQKTGVGTRMDVETAVGPFRTKDVMEVVGWQEGESIEVRHVGLVRGQGVLGVSADGEDGSMVTWDETLVFPWWLGGGLTAWLARPVLRAIWRGNLRRLEMRVSDL